MIVEQYEHGVIHIHHTNTGWEWTIFENDSLILNEEKFCSQEAALSAAREITRKIEENWRNHGYELEKINLFLEAYSNVNWEKPVKTWLDPLPGGRAWMVHYHRIDDLEPITGMLFFSGSNGWTGETQWIDFLVKTALEIPYELIERGVFNYS
jgi:hypothetical protein